MRYQLQVRVACLLATLVAIGNVASGNEAAVKVGAGHNTVTAKTVVSTAAPGLIAAGPASAHKASAVVAAPPSPSKTHDAKLPAHHAATAAPPKLEAKVSVGAHGPASTAKPVAAAVHLGTIETPAQRLAEYFEPVCRQIEKLQEKHMFKIQSQLKSFIEKTAGKMSACFMIHYAIDPSMSLVTKPQLHTICNSRALDHSIKGSFKQFADCSAKNWDAKLDQEFERINKARANCAKKHEHAKTDPTISLTHDEDELSLISDVVSKVLGDGQGVKADIRLLDLTVPSKATSIGVVTKAAATSAKPATSHASHSAATVAKVATAHVATIATSPAPKNHVAIAATHAQAGSKSSTPGVVATAAKAAGHVATTIKVHSTHAPAPAKATTHAPVVAAHAPAAVHVATTAAKVTTHAPSLSHLLPSTKKPVNNTGLVLVHSSSKAASTAAPGHAALHAAPAAGPALSHHHSTGKPAVAAAHPIGLTTTKPSALGDKIAVAAGFTTHVPLTTASAGAKAATSAAAAAAVAATKGAATTAGPSSVVLSKSTTVIAVRPTTAAPAANHKVTSAHPTKLVAIKAIASGTTTKKPSTGTTKAAAPKATSATVSVKVTKTESSTAKPTGTTGKPSASTKKPDEKAKKDAHEAIKSLLQQRAQGHGSPADIRMHQIEHERQMAIDPIGHTLKHQQYELSKKKSAKAAAKS